MSGRGGVQREILASLALVMGLSTLLLAALFLARGEASLRSQLAVVLLAESREPRADGVFPGTDWWVVAGDVARPYGGVRSDLDPATRALAERARREGTLVQPGAPWSRIRFATPGREPGTVRVARLPRSVSLRMRAIPMLVLLGLLLANVAAFTGFGAVLLRHRVVRPLQNLAGVARARALGEDGLRAPEEGVAEVAELAREFNEMNQALEERRLELTKAVVELREANVALRETQAGLDRAERLAAVGSLASGVAHEVGNPMGAILTFVDLASRDPNASEETRSHLAKASREGERVRVILRQLLDFSRPSRGQPAPVDLAEAAREVVALVSAQRRCRNVDFSVEAAPGGAPVIADPAAITQILMNLALNAADACEDASGERRVRLAVRPVVARRRAGDPAGEAAPQRRHPDAMECVVSDTGTGIAEADRERVFDPFFTTKPPGQGTGLGLSNATRQAEEQGGSLSLESPPEGFSTSLALKLPVARRPRGDARAPQSASGSAADCVAEEPRGPAETG
ncbi:MAG: HAMP domain-containing sensor histidine kinase [Myxococcota bacterium]|nr:HAMP domain-containing sensor histidine kinase [Myxococcota bacterium]